MQLYRQLPLLFRHTNAMPVDQKILDKLQKLLALSASENGNEAALALKKAQTIMNEHNLTVFDVAEDGASAEICDKRVWGSTKNCQKWEASLGNEIARAFDGRAIISSTNDGWYLTFIASKTEAAIIVDLFERLRITIRRMSKAYVEQHKPDAPWPAPITIHNSYRIGIITTIRKRLRTLRENTRPDARVANQFGLTGTDLVVIKNQAVDERTQKLFGRGIHREKDARPRVYSNAYTQGKKDGDRINLHRSVAGKNPDLLPERPRRKH